MRLRQSEHAEFRRTRQFPQNAPLPLWKKLLPGGAGVKGFEHAPGKAPEGPPSFPALLASEQTYGGEGRAAPLATDAGLAAVGTAIWLCVQTAPAEDGITMG